MQGRELPYRSLLIPPLQIKELVSTDMIASDDALFVAALRFIRDRGSLRSSREAAAALFEFPA